MNLGHSAAWDQQWDRAAAYYRQALAEFPDNPTSRIVAMSFCEPRS